MTTAVIQEPGVITQQPGVTTQQPGVTTQQPGVTTQQPGVIIPQSQFVVQQPGIIIPQSQFGFQQPGVIIPQSQFAVQQVTNEREWSTGLFDCFEDWGSCAYAWLCPCCFASKVVSMSGEGCTCCVPGVMIAIRMKVRTRLQIKGTLCNDCMADTFFGPCSACQMYREIRHSANGQL